MATEVEAGLSIAENLQNHGHRAWDSLGAWLRKGGDHRDGPARMKKAPVSNQDWAGVFEKFDEALEIFFLFLAVALVLSHEFSKLPGLQRWGVLLLYSLPLDLACCILSRLPWQVMTAQARNGAYFRRSTLRTAAATAVTYDGSFLSPRGRRLFYVGLAAILTHAPDLLTGSLVNEKRAPSWGETPGIVTVGPVGGGNQAGSATTFWTSGLKTLTLDSEETDRAVFKKVGGNLLIPMLPQEMRKGPDVMSVRAKSWPTVCAKLLSEAKPTVVDREACSPSSQLGEKFRFEIGHKIEAKEVYLSVDYDPKGEQPQAGNIAVYGTYALEYGTADVEFDTTSFGVRIVEVSNFQRNEEKPAATEDDLASAIKDMCVPFGNIVHYGVSRHSGNIQADRVAVSTIVRTASKTSIVGFNNRTKGLEMEVRLTKGKLAFRPPIWFTWAFVGMVVFAGLLSGYKNSKWGPKPLGRGIGHLLSVFGRDAAENTSRCAPSDVRARQEYRDDSNSELITFGAAIPIVGQSLGIDIESQRTVDGVEVRTAARSLRRRVAGSVEREGIQTIHLEFNRGENITKGDLSKDFSTETAA